MDRLGMGMVVYLLFPSNVISMWLSNVYSIVGQSYHYFCIHYPYVMYWIGVDTACVSAMYVVNQSFINNDDVPTVKTSVPLSCGSCCFCCCFSSCSILETYST